MSHEEEGSQGTGLGDIFTILSQAPSERLLSLTLQLSASPEDVIVQALCLIILKREVLALDKLRTLADNPLAEHLAEKLHPDRSEDFSVHCGQFQANTRESLSALARIFRVLSQQRLCDQTRRDLAYERALSSDGSSSNLDEFREEAKLVCGPKVLEWMCSSNNPKLELMNDFKTCLNVSDSTLKTSPSASVNSAPSPLKGSPSEPSYPSTLEISSPGTVSFRGDKVSQETVESSEVKPATLMACETETKMSSGQPLLSLLQPTGSSLSDPERSHPTLPIGPLEHHPDTPRSHTNPPSSTNICGSRCPIQKKIHDSKGSDEEEEEEEETFYAFVILHAPEDEDVAERIKDKIEEVISSKGATFSEEFAIPGKCPLRCVEDAINNSAFTFLLLTCNFKSNLLEMKANIALMNAIHKIHKFNTVIPLLPRENRMPRDCIPMALKGLVELDENKNFEKKLQKSLSRAKIQTQKKVWKKEQTLRMTERQSQLQETLRMGLNLNQEESGEDNRTWQQKHPSIHIENANYIMIGNDSKMVLGSGGSADKEESVYIKQD
ncbi:TIR domain-containing adapter molecule 1 [Oryzias melastigma]|uniref:TIR domain containing adaptor molecule 1 n=1 Tax=Oryzias melastigma TaxID=30732 RepID=A0A3B3DZD1_ORYME|nr:TIR domain-containing adapter molecule 1 [Oryzias melastigma]